MHPPKSWCISLRFNMRGMEYGVLALLEEVAGLVAVYG